MTFQEYSDYFKTIIGKPAAEQLPPYNREEYLEYTRHNWEQMNRWITETGELAAPLKKALENIKAPQRWIVITEPWCGDAAHNVPFIEMASRINPLVTISYELRDAEPYRINQYLTNGGKSIPKLVIKTPDGKDLAQWGPRPADCQKIYSALASEKASFDTIKTTILNWYDHNKGRDIQEELSQMLAPII
jgi:hypothetical protein